MPSWASRNVIGQRGRKTSLYRRLLVTRFEAPFDPIFHRRTPVIESNRTCYLHGTEFQNSF